MATTDAPQGSSTRPYLLRALHEWCTDNGFTPYIAVQVDATVQVPAEYVKNNEIVLNIGFEATSALKLGNEFIEFKARFGGVAREIVVPVDHVVAIYARENGQGMAFPMPTAAEDAPAGLPAGGTRATRTKPATPAVAPKPLRLARQGGMAPQAPATSGSRPETTRSSGPGAPGGDAGASSPEAPQPPSPPGAPRPSLKRIK